MADASITYGETPLPLGPRHDFRETLLMEALGEVLASRPRGAGGAPARVLDAGCGAGSLLVRLRAAGHRAVGVEPSLGLTRRAGVELVAGVLETLPFRDGAFDAVVTGEVLEHLPDDVAALRELRRVLVPGGALALSVPADPALWTRRDVYRGHQRRYREADLRDVLVDGGFEPRTVRRWGFPLSLAWDLTAATLAERRAMRARAEPAVRAPRADGEGAAARRPLVALRDAGARAASRAIYGALQVDRLFDPLALGLGWVATATARPR